MWRQGGHPFYQQPGSTSIVIHDIPLALFGFALVLAQPAHGGTAAVELTVAGIDRSTPYRGIAVVSKHAVPALPPDVAIYTPASKRYVNVNEEQPK